MARGTTIEAEAPRAARKRKVDSETMLHDSAQPVEARVKTTVPISSGARLPNRSHSGPWTIWPTARPANQVASVICALPASACRLCSMAGNAGR